MGMSLYGLLSMTFRDLISEQIYPSVLFKWVSDEGASIEEVSNKEL